jgi:AcrR family transcriptional regulator
MVRPTKQEQIPDLAEAIKDTAWEQIAKKGAAALSLRAIARQLEITAPAIYNYFPRRDDLVTALIVDAFISLGESQENALQGLHEVDFESQISTLGLGYRDWAITYPQRYQLIFGTPIPNYEAPAEITIPAAAASLVPLTETLQACQSAGRLKIDRFAPMTPDLKIMLDTWRKFTGGTDIEVLYTTLVFWSRVHGLVSLEIGQQFPAQITDPGELFRREISNLVIQYLKEPG